MFVFFFFKYLVLSRSRCFSWNQNTLTEMIKKRSDKFTKLNNILFSSTFLKCLFLQRTCIRLTVYSYLPSPFNVGWCCFFLERIKFKFSQRNNFAKEICLFCSRHLHRCVFVTLGGNGLICTYHQNTNIFEWTEHIVFCIYLHIYNCIFKFILF